MGCPRGTAQIDERIFLNVFVLLLSIEAGTVLVDAREVAVAEDDGFGVIDAKRLEQGVQSGFLRCSARVLGTALGVETALVADADAVLVVVAGMGAGEVLVAGLIYLAVAGDVVVVAGEAEAAVVVGDEPRDGVRLVLAGRRTVNNDEFYFAHSF